MNQQVQGKASTSKPPKVAIVLGSGVLTSLGAVSLFNHLHEWRIPVDMTIGCSGGAMGAAVWGAGLDLHSILLGVPELIDRSKTFGKLNYRTLSAMAGVPYLYDRSIGVWKSSELLSLYHDVFEDMCFEDLDRTIRLEATDLDDCKAFTINKGSVAEAVYASTALFPFLPPIMLHDRWLCDGGWTNPVPVLYPIRMGYDVVIGLNIGVRIHGQPKNFLEHIFYFFSQVNGESEVAQRGIVDLAGHTDTVVINYNFDHPLDFDGIDDVDTVLKELEDVISPHESNVKKLFNSFNSNGGKRHESS